MKIQELRELAKASDREHLEKAFAECYKLLRKAQKDEFDSVMKEILEGKENQKKKTKTPFPELEQEIQIFIKNAYAQNYLVPNHVIPKNQRSKWRFAVKNFLKELEKIPLESEYYENSVSLLTDLYKMLCYACDFYLFSSDDPFRSIGWEQSRLYDLLLKKTFASGYSREKIANMLSLASGGGLSREALHSNQKWLLLAALKTSDVKYIAIEEAKKLVQALEEGVLENIDPYERDDMINELSGMILMTTVVLSEAEEGIEYYFKHSNEYREEITLYCALDQIEYVDDNAAWIQAYEYGIQKKIKPRKDLVEAYKYRKNKKS